MSPTLRLGRVFGIDISANWSLVFVFALIVWSLATGIPADVPHRPTSEYLLAGIAGGLLFYLSLLTHELAHSLLARRFGVDVSGITLWLFGGVSQLQGEPRSARQEALITAVGPLSSLVLAAVFYGIAWLLPAGGVLDTASAVFVWLAYINVALGLFNLVPAFPLDGGRLVSALIWWRTGSRRAGVHRAVRIGRWFALAMIAIGLVELIAGQVLNGVWLAFLGWFLLSAAAAEESGADIRELLHRVPVSAAMTSPVVTLPDWLTVEQFLRSEAPTHPFTTYPVRNVDGRLTGVVRLPEVVNRHAAGDRDRRLSDVAHPIAEVPVARPADDLGQLLERVGQRLQLRILVFDGDQLAGIVSPVDIARLLARRQALRPLDRR